MMVFFTKVLSKFSVTILNMLKADTQSKVEEEKEQLGPKISRTFGDLQDEKYNIKTIQCTQYVRVREQPFVSCLSLLICLC